MTNGSRCDCSGRGTRSAVRLAGMALLCAALTGCAGRQLVDVRATPHNPLAEQLSLYARGGPRPSARTRQILRQCDLAGMLRDDGEVLASLAAIHARYPRAGLCYALAELSYIAAKKAELTDRARAQELYVRTVGHTYAYLFDPQYAAGRNPYDPQFRGACDLYNEALESCLRAACKSGDFVPGHQFTFAAGDRTIEVSVVPKGSSWQAEDFERFEFVSDYELTGLRNQFRTYGLGVPLIAVRRAGSQPPEIERHYARGLSFPMTAFLRLDPSAAGSDRIRVALELYDPLETTEVSVAGTTVPLESDVSTPLAFFLNDPDLHKLDTWGLLRPDALRQFAGLYMLQPYQPDKIPVVMVHGLWSSPMTWMEVLNDLRSSRTLRENYQFWFYLYPTGEPFWKTAAALREDLAEVRRTFDPQRRQPALDDMVLIGHSMGGLISRLMTLDSGHRFWSAVSDRPLQQVSASVEVRHELERVYFFEAQPSVTRVITIGSPHRGSSFANRTTRWLGRQLIALPKMTLETTQELLSLDRAALNLRDSYVARTSIDSLAPESPILQVMLEAPKPAGVTYHNVVGVTESDVPLEENSDGVVSFLSAHLDDVESELVVPAAHSDVHRHPRTVLEIRRILRRHLEEIRRQQSPEILPVRGEGPGRARLTAVQGN